MFPSLQEGAIFIADAHYPHHGDTFVKMLRRLESGTLQTSQLFLMGDNFDILFGHNTLVLELQKETIALLNHLSKTIEIHYFEGNHDFLLREIFPKIKIYPRQSQPQFFLYGDQKVGLSHGDKYEMGWHYHLFSVLLRNRFVLPWMSLIVRKMLIKLPQKKICHSMENFKKRAEKIVQHYPKDVDLIIEGHYHQACIIGNYIALPSLACQSQFGVMENGNMVFKRA